MTVEELLRVEAARRLGDPFVPPVGAVVAFSPFLSVVGGRIEHLEGEVVAVDALVDVSSEEVDLSDTYLVRVAAFGLMRVVVGGGEVLEVPAGSPPFESWERKR